jgi:hypothetical protein
MATCRKGIIGKTACRLAMGRRECLTTHPVVLVPAGKHVRHDSNNHQCIPSNNEPDLDDNNSENSSCLGTVENDENSVAGSEVNYETSDTELDSDGTHANPYAYSVVDPVPNNASDMLYHVPNVLDNRTNDDPIVCWAPNRNPVQVHNLNNLQAEEIIPALKCVWKV